MRKLLQLYRHRVAALSLSKLPLWIILVIPFTSTIIVVVALTSYLSHRASENAVNDLAEQLLREINHRVDAHLESFLETPSQINETNATAFHHQYIDVSDSEQISHYLWEEVQVYDSVSSIYIGNAQGGLISAGREGAGGAFYLIQTENFLAGPLDKYAIDLSGNPTDLLVHVPEFDSRIRPWYIGAVERRDIYWTDPYVLSTGQDLAIACSLPVYDESGDLIAVVAVDLFISQISDFMQDLEIGETGQAYIVDPSGLLVATSNGASPFSKGEDNTWQRSFAVDSSDTIIANSAQYFSETSGGFSAIADQQQHVLEIGGKPYYLWVTPYHNEHGLNWYVVTTIPQNEFLGDIEAQNRVTLLVTILAAMLAIALGILAALLVSRPIARLSAVATSLAGGNWSQQVQVEGVEELRQLGEAFNIMTAQLHLAFSTLEERVCERTAELETSEARYRAIVEDQTELICRFLPNNTITFVNEAYCRYFDETADRLMQIDFMSRLPDEDRIKLGQQLSVLNLERPTVTVEHRVIRPDGEIRWMQWVNRALFDSSGKFLEIQAVGRDITEDKQFEEALRKALAREMELNTLKSQFVSTVSHEFRTPLAIILSSWEIIQLYGDRLAPERRAEHFRRIRSQIDRMTALLEDVLTINKAETGKLEFRPELIDLAVLCETVIGEIRASNTNRISCEFVTEGACTTVYVDKKLAQLILTNLISNAAKYSAADATTRLGLRCTPDEIIMTVMDEGLGIPANMQAHIFEPFYRAENVASIAGTGLGLAIVRQSVEQYGGTISFVSEVGKGTTFTVTLPILPEQEYEKNSDY